MIQVKNESVIGNDLFNAPERFKVVTINCVGAMGRGIALSCKERYPTLYEDYRAKCRQHQVVLGEVLAYPEHDVLLFPTKFHFKDPANVEWIIDGLNALVGTDYTDVALPPLGMANGWLSPRNRQYVFGRLLRILGAASQSYVIYLPDKLYDELVLLKP